ncbi:hypothetical protein [Actinomycetospora atypica]|uniref:Uncharacterized protein n=1 Tax=Actinomycetospora atypica TaxID=1290095 RepID=A0ABV9YF85_9PSEU
MSDLHDDLGLESSPRVPGGGQAPRWRVARITSRFFWIWLGLTLTSLAVLAAVLVAWVREGISDTGIVIFVLLVILLPLLLAASYAAIGAAVDSRVDDDVLVHGVGVGAALATEGYADWPFTWDGRPAGHLARLGKKGARRLVVGTETRQVAPRGAGFALLDGRRTVATAVPRARGPWRDWEIDVAGRLLRVRQHVARQPPRRTLLDDLGRAWRTSSTRRSVEARLPEEIGPVGAAFCLVVLAAIRDTVAPVAPQNGSGDSGDSGGVDLSDGGWSFD